MRGDVGVMMEVARFATLSPPTPFYSKTAFDVEGNEVGAAS